MYFYNFELFNEYSCVIIIPFDWCRFESVINSAPSPKAAGYLLKGAVTGVFSGFLSSISLLTLIKLIKVAKLWLVRISGDLKHRRVMLVQLRQSCFIVAYISAICWLVVKYGKVIGIPEVIDEMIVSARRPRWYKTWYILSSPWFVIWWWRVICLWFMTKQMPRLPITQRMQISPVWNHELDYGRAKSIVTILVGDEIARLFVHFHVQWSLLFMKKVTFSFWNKYAHTFYMSSGRTIRLWCILIDVP